MEDTVNIKNSGSLSSIVNACFSDAYSKLVENGTENKEAVSKLLSKIDPVINSLYDMASNDIFEYMKDHMFEVYCKSNREDIEFRSHLDLLWGDCIAASQTMYVISIEAAETHSKHVSESISKKDFIPLQYTFQTLQHLQGRACQVFLEILELVKGGFADGAFARWRSLYELCCIGQFIVDNGEIVAQKYFDQAETDNQKYHWANSVIDKNNKKVETFGQIQDMCGMNPVWVQEYKLGCLLTHASAQGTFKRLSNYKTLNSIPVGRSDFGVDIPAAHAAQSLSWITSLLLAQFPNIDSITHSNVLNKWSTYTESLYHEKRIAVFGDDSAQDEKAE